MDKMVKVLTLLEEAIVALNSDTSGTKDTVEIIIDVEKLELKVMKSISADKASVISHLEK